MEMLCVGLTAIATLVVVMFVLAAIYSVLDDSSDDTKTNYTGDEDEENIEYVPVSIAGEEGEKEVDMTVSFNLPSFRVIRNLYVPQGEGRATEIDMVLVHTSGIYVLEVKNYTGWIFGSEGQRYWTQASYRGKHQFYNPLMQNRGHINSLQRFLGVNSFIYHSYIVFTGDCVLKSLTFSTTFHKVVKREWLVNYIKEDASNYGTLLSDDDVASIYEKLLPLTNPSPERKREQIRTCKSAKAIEGSGTRCPLCGGNLVVRRNRTTGQPFWGCSNYPRCRYTRKYMETDRQQSGRVHY